MSVLMEHGTAISARKSLPVCVVDDDADQVELTAGRLERAGFPVTGTTDPQEALQRVRMGGCRVVLVDLKMPAMDGLTFLDKTLEYDPGTYVILITGYYSVDSAIEAIRRGAYDYLCKPVDFLRLEKALDDLAAVFSQRSEVRGLEEKLLQNVQFEGIVGHSPAMLEVFDLCRKVARHYTNVLISGPTGAGKELVARALHHLSPVGAGTVCGVQLLGAGRYAAGEPAVWPHAGFVYGRQRHAAGPV